MSSDNTFDMLDIAARYTEAAKEQKFTADIKKLKDILIKSVKILSDYYQDVPSVHVCKCINKARSVDAVLEVIESHYVYGPLQGAVAYTGSGIQISDFYSHIDKQTNRLWKHMVKVMKSGSFNGSVCTILFRPRRSRNIWLLTTGAVPEHPLAPRIVIPSVATTYPNITIVRLDALVPAQVDK